MSDDFFTSVPFTGQDTNQEEAHDFFAQAIAVRFGSADLLTARLLPGEVPKPNTANPRSRQPNHHAQHSSLPPPPPLLPSMSLQPSRPAPAAGTSAPLRPKSVVTIQSFTSVPPLTLASYLSDPSALILDIRPHAAHASARIHRALSLSVPSTLLKRPLFSLSKLSQMLPSPSARARFAAWPSATRILVYDADSALTPDTSNIAGLLRKFRAEGFTGDLGWVRGGFQAVWRDAREFATTEQLSPDEDDTEVTAPSGALRTRHLPKAAFSLSSTTAVVAVGTLAGTRLVPQTPAAIQPRAANPFFDTIRQNVELSQGITERIPLRLPRRVRRRISELPFRWLQDIARRSAVRHPSSSSRSPVSATLESGSESTDDPHTSDPDENDPDVEEGTEALAMQFYRIELAEQRRLRTIMEHHSRESEGAGAAATGRQFTVFRDDRAEDNMSMSARTVPSTPHPAAFPFSITAGVEKGTKNRYTHIWPFEHARVRLHDGRHQGSHPGKRDKGKSADRDCSAREREQGQVIEKEKERRSRSSPGFGANPNQLPPATGSSTPGTSRHLVDFDMQMWTSGTSSDGGADGGQEVEMRSQQQSPPHIRLEIEVTNEDTCMSEPPTPATAIPFPTPPFYTPMETWPTLTPMHTRSAQLSPLPPASHSTSVAAAEEIGETQFALPASSLPSLGPLPSSFRLHLPGRLGGPWPLIDALTSTTSPSTSLCVPLGGIGAGVPGLHGQVATDASAQSQRRRAASPADDYVNASYVQPLGTQKRYIATQGPLPATFVDFWTLVWEQNVHVIVMLTREVENAMVKCGTYWTDTQYGPLRLELLATSPPTSPSVHPSSTDASKQGFFFALREPPTRNGGGSKAQPTTVTRTFALSHMSYPGVPPRRITHLQYLDWPDMNVPEDPRGVLDLVKQVEQAVAGSTPGPSPSGSAAGSGSLSPGSTSFFSSLAHIGGGAEDIGGWKRRGQGWRHPELDLKTGIAASALGKPAPVLLHCSAGVGRTGGFIAVDAVLDGVRRELRRSREAQMMKKAAGVVLGMGDADVSTETGISGGSRGDDSIIGEGEEMDVDKSAVEMAEEAQDQPQIVGTVPLYVSAGDRKKGWRHHHHHGTNLPEEKSSSSESLVMHVPCAGASDASKDDKVAELQLDDPQKPGWQPSSTREWAEQVSDQTHTCTEEEEPPLPIDMPMSLSSLPAPSRERSPGSTSISSGPFTLSSVDDSAEGSAGVTGSGAERKSAADSGSGDPPPSSVSKSTSGFASGSISASNSGSGTGTGSGSRFGSSSGMESSSFMSLMRARLRDSSATSLCLSSTDSSSPENVSKSVVPLRQPSAIHVSSGARLGLDVVADHPSRSVSAPLHPTGPTSLHQQRSNQKPSLGSSPVASLSTPALPTTATARGVLFFSADAAEEPVSRPSSGPSSDELMSPPQEFESGASADIEGSRTGDVKSIRALSDSSDENAASSKSGSIANIAIDLSSAKELEPTCRNCTIRDALAHREAKEKAMIAPMPRVLEHSVIQSVVADLGAARVDRRAAGHSVIDYKLPRELHCDSSPPPISSLAEPICMVVQDMREQRMSLCQSLRQYVFVHAAVIEGALEIVDEERELWGDIGVSDEGHFAEIELMPGINESGRKSDDRGAPKVWFGEGGDNGGQPRTSASSLSGIAPSPFKGKRGPSPTELCREDKTGALSLNKRPSIKYKLPSDEAVRSAFAPDVSSSMAGGTGGPAKQTSMSATWSMLGGPPLPPKGTPSGPAR
ncbi:hypothetical protein PAXRUDRAFT_157888 [Paxillus rubicundulus Ve08.2h10]|uniref:protein-tyrosine-phosphatase n=1 Tax=Paxillus rubicundulus Ve08.2h10 TaxID=930991 RepID=A0A0D0CYK9_9AGAM|nr:hypothetical protein PAXRUDRAFT_157888 [Paxillus rubicundulus Ve08.2h10]